jgi:hypothetical protein
VILRVVYILSANPIGEFAQELVYLRVRELRAAGYAVFIVILVELAQLVVPFLTRREILHDMPTLSLFLDAAQAALIAIAALLVLMVVRRYTHRALDRRIRESMETLAYLEGQRRRRRSLERGEYEPREDEE